MLVWSVQIVLLEHNVEYRGSKSRLPTLALQCSKGGHLERGACQRGLKFGLFSGYTLMILLEIFMESGQPGTPLPGEITPHALRRTRKHSKTPCPGWEVAKFCEAAKGEWQGDTLMCRQNSLTTVGKSRGSPDRHHQQQQRVKAVRSFADQSDIIATIVTSNGAYIAGLKGKVWKQKQHSNLSALPSTCFAHAFVIAGSSLLRPSPHRVLLLLKLSELVTSRDGPKASQESQCSVHSLLVLLRLRSPG